jgi:hypothetical protein
LNKTILAVGILFLPLISNGQDLIICAAPTINDANYIPRGEGGHFSYPNFGINLSLDYLFTNEKKIVYGFGFGYQYSRVKFKPEYEPQDSYLESANLISIDSKFILRLKTKSFISIDPFIGLHINSSASGSIYNQTGLGLSIGYGRIIPVNESLRIFIEPRWRLYRILPIPYDDWPRRLIVLGLKIGICFNI